MTDPLSLAELIQAHCLLFDRVSMLLQRLDASGYVKTSAVLFHSSIGGHVRHCLEHYQSLLQGLPTGRVNYDLRPRNSIMETQAEAALRCIEDLRSGLSQLATAAETTTIHVLMDHGAESSAGTWQQSTLGRELQFLISHTVHHFALIAGLCHLHGITLDQEFGLAPSTARHRQSVQR